MSKTSQKKANRPGQYKVRRRAPLDQIRPFTPGRVIQIIKDVGGSRYAAPGITEAKLLSSILNVWQSRYRADREIWLMMDMLALLDDAGEMYAKIASEIIQQAARLSKMSLSIDIVRLKETRDNILDLVALVARVRLQVLSLLPAKHDREHLKQLGPKGRHLAGWIWIGEVLATDITNTMRVGNPEYPRDDEHDRASLGSASRPGPTPRLMAAFIPGITGENPTASTIVTQLSKRRRGGGPRGNRPE